MSESIIKIKDLNYYDVFNDFRIEFEKDKFITISGANNCGKTSLIRILSRKEKVKNCITLLDKKYEDYKIDQYVKLVKCIIPQETDFICDTVEEELFFAANTSSLSKESKKQKLKEIIKDFKLTKIKKQNPNNLNRYEVIRLQFSTALIDPPRILLIDSIDQHLNRQEMLELLETLKKYKQNLTIIMTTTNLEYTLYSDYLYILTESLILLEGKPLEVLEKDNILNKVGLKLPFMIDLSVKLRDYDLMDQLELDMDRMVNILWK